jgi:hypothetical protein
MDVDRNGDTTMKLRVTVPIKSSTLKIGPANLIALAASTVLVLIAFCIVLRLNAGAHDLQSDSAQLRITRDQVARWQIIAPTILHNEARARADLRPYCSLGADLNGTLLHIASRLNAPGSQVFVSSGNYLVSTQAPPVPATLASSAPSPNASSSPQPTSAPAPSAVRDANTPLVGDGYLEIQKPLTVEGPYPAVIRSLLSVDTLNYPLTVNPPRVSRKGEREVTLATTFTLRVPSRDLCDATAYTGPGRALAPRTLTTTRTQTRPMHRTPNATRHSRGTSVNSTTTKGAP